MHRRRKPSILPRGLRDKIRSGLEVLLEAYLYAEDVARDVWDFAVEIRSLRDAGLTGSDLRWLVCKGFVAHRIELPESANGQRSFQDAAGGLTFHERSCFVLTSAGSDIAKDLGVLRSGDGHAVPSLRQTSDGTGHPKRIVPKWDAACRELRVDGEVVKQFKLPAPREPDMTCRM